MKQYIGYHIVLWATLVCVSVFLLKSDLANVEDTNSALWVPASFDKHNVFATNTTVDITTLESGSWSKPDQDGYVEWEYTTQQEAASLNFGFSEFVLPASAVFRIYNKKNRLCQEYLPKSINDHHLELWTPIMKGDFAKFSLRILAAEKAQLKWRLSSINLGIQHLRSGDEPEFCLIDIHCEDLFPQIGDFTKETQSVGLITIEGTRICSGVLLNNVKQDFTPYFLTGRHCGINAENAASVVVHWNYENSFCRYESEENGSEGDGSLEQFNTGATYLSDLQRSDFTLLRLNDPVIEEANAYFAGWDATSKVPENVTTIHHANTLEKRITFAEGKTSITRHFGVEEDPDLNHIRVNEWSISSTASGSSGAPLFDENHRVVGQLHGGLAACDNEESDWFGRLFTSWLGDEVPERQLKHWLDPEDTGREILDGKWDELEPLGLQVSIIQIDEVNCPGDETASIRINIANGTGPYTYSIDGGESYQSQPQFQNLGAGVYSILVKDGSENTSIIVPFIIREPEAMRFTYTRVYNQITLSIEGGEPPFLFSNNGAISFDSVYNNVPVGVITYSVLDANGCSGELEIEVTYDELQAQIDVVEGISCFDTVDGVIGILHSGSAGPYQYQLNNGPLATDNIFENLPPGQYTARVIDSLGNIVSTETVALLAPERLEMDLIQVEENVLVIPSGGVQPYVYQYDDGAITENNQFNLEDNIEWITVIDANGCTVETLNLFTSGLTSDMGIEFSLFPNPASDYIFLEAKGGVLESYIIQNLQGQTLQNDNLNQENNGIISVDINNLDAGIYFFRANMKQGGTKVLKFIVL